MGAFIFPQLSPVVRKFMLEEIQYDIASSGMPGVYISPRLNAEGQAAWISLLKESVEKHDERWLADSIRQRGFLKDTEERKNPRGGPPIKAKVPFTAADTLAEGEFNRYYMRAICSLTMSRGGQEVEVFRAKQVDNPRDNSEAQIGQKRNAAGMIVDLRANQVDAALGIPPGPNSGLSIRCDSMYNQ